MAKILLNPEDGAPITNVQVKGQILFKDKPFGADSMRKIESNEMAEDLLNLFGFLRVLGTKEDVENYIAEKKKRAFRCDKCDFASSVEIALKGHLRKHEAEGRMTDELGIEVVSENIRPELSNEEIELLREEAEKKHLESGGITAKWEDETSSRSAAM